MNTLKSIGRQRALSLCAALALTVGMGCASGPPEALKFQLIGTDTSIGQAEQAGAAQSALPELQQAKDKRAKAEAAMHDKKYDVAMNFARQAQLDAQFASRKSEAARANRSASEVTRGTDALEKETDRANVAAEKEATKPTLSNDR